MSGGRFLPLLPPVGGRRVGTTRPAGPFPGFVLLPPVAVLPRGLMAFIAEGEALARTLRCPGRLGVSGGEGAGLTAARRWTLRPRWLMTGLGGFVTVRFRTPRPEIGHSAHGWDWPGAEWQLLGRRDDKADTSGAARFGSYRPTPVACHRTGNLESGHSRRVACRPVAVVSF